MTLIIDGHNLIPNIPGLHLDQLDDEESLIRRVAAFCSLRRKRAEIYFDKAAAGQAHRLRHGPVTAVFVSNASSADAAIRRRLAELGRQARNCTVVSSDRAVQAEARAAGAHVQASDLFARQLREAFASTTDSGSWADPADEDEIADWLDLFGES